MINYGYSYKTLFTKCNPFANGAPYSKLFNLNIINSHNILFETNLSYGEDLVFFIFVFKEH